MAPSSTTASPSEAAQTTASASQAVKAGTDEAYAALAELATLPVKGRAPKTGYTRAQFGPAWTDDVAVADGHNGCDTRNDILARDLTGVTFKPGSHDCAVLSGNLHDPYTGRIIAFHRGVGSSSAVQIDHLVALSDAWQTGAQQLPADRRQDFANDPLNLEAVDGPTNEAKGDGDAATWLPPNKAYRCTYVSRQVAVKAKYDLWVTPAEHDAIVRVLDHCPAPAASRTTSPSSPTTTPSPRTTTQRAPVPSPPVRTTAPPAPAGCRPLSNGGHCYRVGQFCAKRYRGTNGISADGRPMTCRDVNGWRWEPS